MTYHIRQEKFEGPLELLLDLIEREELAVSAVSLARVAEEYLAHTKRLVSPDPEELAGFLLMAAHLILIKSRSLLPGIAIPEEEEQSIAELEERLRMLQAIRGAALQIREMERRHRRMHSRPLYAGIAPAFYPPPGMTPDILMRAFAAAVALIPKAEKLAEEKIKRIISLEEKIAHLQAILQGALERGFSDIIRGAGEKIEIVVSFLALLELAKDRFIYLRQDELFSEIFVKKV